MKKGRLYLIPSVIAEGDTSSIPEQVRKIIPRLEYYLVENVRTARRYISSLRSGVDIGSLQFEELNKNTRADEIEKLMAPLLAGKDMGVMSEAGCPGIADPGSRAVDYAHRKGIKVIPLVGPSSIMLALMASGFNGQRFCFHGYLPIDKDKLSPAIKNLEKNSARYNQTEIFIETPYRNNTMLTNLLKFCHDNTRLCIARDITGEYELIQTNTIKRWKEITIDLHKKPTVFLLFSA